MQIVENMDTLAIIFLIWIMMVFNSFLFHGDCDPWASASDHPVSQENLIAHKNRLQNKFNFISQTDKMVLY